MALSSGTRTAAMEAASWVAAGAVLVSGLVYFDELKSLFIPPPTTIQTASAPRMIGSKSPVETVMPQTAAVSSGHHVELKAGPYGHFKTPARINGREINVLVDTGASYVALTWEDAERAGIYVNTSDFKYRTRTANGISHVAIVNIGRISIGNIEVRNVRASVHQRGRLHVTLLGMSFLGKLRRAEMRSGRMILEN